jgi:hypothetical protein
LRPPGAVAPPNKKNKKTLYIENYYSTPETLLVHTCFV